MIREIDITKTTLVEQTLSNATEGIAQTTSEENKQMRTKLKKGGDISRADSNPSKVQRYNLVLPKDLFKEIQVLAEARNTTIVELVRKFIKLGLLAAQIENDKDSMLIIREHDTERQILMF